MILYKKLTAEEALEAIGSFVSSFLTDEIKNSDAELTLTFNPDHSVEIYLINLPQDENTKDPHGLS